jgi:hypothetical protein
VRRTGRRLCFHRCPFLSRKIWWPFFLERFILHCRRPGLVLSLQEQFQFFFPGFDFFGSKSCHKRCSQGELFPLVLLPSQPTVQFSMPFSFLLALWRSVFAALTVGTAIPLWRSGAARAMQAHTDPEPSVPVPAQVAPTRLRLTAAQIQFVSPTSASAYRFLNLRTSLCLLHA